MPIPVIENGTSSLAALIDAAFAADCAATPCFNWARCGQRATIEKVGRSVCHACAATLRGTEYPLRHPSTESLYASDRHVAEALDMLEDRPDADRRTSRRAGIDAGIDSDHSQFS